MRSGLKKNSLRHLSSLQNLESLDLTWTQVEAGDIEALSSLKKLSSLSVENCPLGDDGLSHISKIRNLRVLTIV